MKYVTMSNFHNLKNNFEVLDREQNVKNKM